MKDFKVWWENSKQYTLPVYSINSMLMPSKHDFVKLLILKAHEDVLHNGIRDTLPMLRERFWVLRGREAVKSIIRKCVTCGKHKVIPYN